MQGTLLVSDCNFLSQMYFSQQQQAHTLAGKKTQLLLRAYPCVPQNIFLFLYLKHRLTLFRLHFWSKMYLYSHILWFSPVRKYEAAAYQYFWKQQYAITILCSI